MLLLALNIRSFSTFWFVLFVWEFPLSRCLSSTCACVALSHAVRGTRVVFGAAIALLLFALRSKKTTRVFFGFYDLELEQKTPWKAIFCWFFSFLSRNFYLPLLFLLFPKWWCCPLFAYCSFDNNVLTLAVFVSAGCQNSWLRFCRFLVIFIWVSAVFSWYSL